MPKKPEKMKPLILLEDDDDGDVASPIPDDDGWIKLKREQPKPEKPKRPRREGRKK